jgi:hypothetical protein
MVSNLYCATASPIRAEDMTMNNETYKISKQEAQTLNIQELLRHSSGLTIKLGLAEDEIGRLRLQMERLEDGKMALKLKLEEANAEIGRLAPADDHGADDDS